MADSLIFPIGFDLEKGVKDAQGQIDVVLRRLQKTVDGKPLSIRADIDTSKFSVFEAALRGSIQHITDDATRLKTALDTALKTDNSANINRITEAMRNLEAVWKLLPNNQKFDANGKLTAKAQELIRQFNELATASNTYGQTLTQIAGKIRRVAEEEAKANQKRNDGYAKLRKTLGAQENSIANLTAKIKAYQQILNSKEIGSKSFERVAEKIRKLTEKLDAARAKVKALTQTTVDNSKRQVDAHKNVTTALGEQNSYLGKLIKRMVVYSSFSQFHSFMSNIKEVTAQFELQRVSLGAIIQDQNKANQLFSEIKTFALKSPISIMDLTKYTKQVAAYRIENDKLFDTTKRLADVSVGLGVDMGRLVLAFGQVKAASFLRSAEIRQFTEAGIPMLELLAEKFSELQGRAVSTEQVMKMVENRMVDFRMVEQIFTDLTSAGGMFYNMQEKQGNTLFGLWAKLGDAASVMYDEIGNTDEATYVMKGAIQLLTDLMHNWRFVGREALVVGATLMVLHTRMKLVSSNTKMAETATNSYTLAQRRLNAAQAGSMTAKAAEAAKRAAVANRAAAMSTNAWTAAKFRLVAVVNQLKAALLGNWVTLAIAAFAAIGMAIYSAYEKAHRLDNELNKIRSEGSVIQDQSVENFNRLAKAAVESANGSKQQRDALEELNRTYKDILPTDALKLENLRKLKGNYESLTQSVREYIAMQQKEKAINTIQEEYGGDIEKIRKTLHSRFTDKLGPWKMSEEQFSAFWAEFVKQSGDATKTFEQRLHAAFETTGKDAEEMMDKVALHTPTSNPFGENYLEKANRLLDEQRVKIEAESKAWDKAAGGLGKFYDNLEQAKKELSETRFISRGKNGEEVGVDKDTFLYQQMQANAAMKKAAQLIREDDTLKQAIQDKQVQLQPEWIHLVDSVNPNDLMNITYVNFDAIIKAVGDKYPDLTKRLEAIKKEWGNVVPNDGIVRLCQDRLSQIANGVKGGMDVMRQYLWNGSGTVDDYLKTLNNQITAMEAELFSAEQAVAKYGVVGAAINFLNGRSIGDVKEQLDGLRKMAEFVQTLVKPTETTSNEPTSTKSDNRLQNLQEIERTLTSINKKYEELTKTEGNTAALEYVRKNYDSTLKYINKLGKQFNLNFAMPTDFKDLQSYRKAIKDVIEQLKMKGHEKAAIELELKIAEGNQAQLQKEIQAKLKALADRISRTKTAKEFYEKILSQTGDVELATRVSLSIYGSTGEELFKDTVAQIREVFKSGKEDVVIGLEPVFDMTNQRINYKMLADIYEKYQNDIIDKNRDTAKKIAQEGQKTTASNIANWQEELAKAQSYEEQRTAIIQRESEKRANIIKDVRDPEERNRLVSLSYDKQAQDLAKLAVDEFKSSDDYIKVFQDLDRVSTQTLDRMKKRLQEMIATVKDTENVDGLKSLVEQLDKINEERETRNPIEGLVNSFKKYAQARKAARTAEAEEAKVKAEFAQQEVGLNRDIQTAKVEQAMAQKRVTDLEAQGLQHTNEYVAAQLALKNAEDKVTQAKERRRKAVKSVEAAEQDTTDATDEMKDAMYDMQKSGQVIVDKFKAAASAIQTIADMMGVAEDSELGDIVNGLVSGLNNAATIMSTILTLAIAIQSACWWLLAIGAAVAAFTAIGSWISNSKVRKANKEIERQQKLLDQLEYAYGRLEKAADKVFGADFVANMNQQQKVLQAQAAAYQKQYEAELSKGKKADEEKLKEYQEAYRDTLDEIADMQGKFAERMAGTDVASAARDFAQAWLEAYASFGDTTGAIKEKFNDLIKNMIVESVMAKTVQMALQPMFDQMDEMYKSGKSMTDVLNYAFSQAAYTSQAISDGLEVNAHLLESLGFNVRDLYATSDNLTGISRDIATASEKDINGLAAHMSTVEYYASTVPGMASDVAAIRVLLEGGAARTTAQDGAFSPIDYTPMFSVANQHLQSLPRIEEQLGQIYTLLNRVMVAKGGKFGINSFYN